MLPARFFREPEVCNPGGIEEEYLRRVICDVRHSEAEPKNLLAKQASIPREILR